jgi:hypothetical protein
MVHGDCSSRGCYAMTDEQIAEIYALGRESFFGGQKSFQFQAYPFRMTALNMARHRNNPNMPFWKMIKEGYDHFEVTRQEPKVDFCEKKYVFDAMKPADAKRDPVFEASAKCPAYIVPEELAQAVREKQEADQAEFVKMVEKGTPVARLNSGVDGGMHKVFAAKLPNGNTGLSEGGQGLALLTLSKPPGTIPPTVNPPRGPVTSPDEPLAASLAPSTSAVRVAAASPPDNQPQSTQSEGFFSSLAQKMGFGSAAAGTTASAAQPASAKPKVTDAKPRSEASKTSAAKADTKQASAHPTSKPTETAAAAPAPAPSQGNLVAGAQPVLSTNSFESRYSAMK